MEQADQATTIFADKAPPVETTTQPEATASADTVIPSLVGEGKKYKTMDELAKAYINADSFIEQLKAENRELREKTVATKTIDDVLDRLQQQQSPATSVDPGVSVADITKLVEQTVTGMETQKVKQSNLLKADAKMKERFGEKAAEVFKKAAATPELSKVYMELASVDPDKFVSLFVEPSAPGTGVDTGGSVNTTVSHSSVTGYRANTVGTKDYYDNIRKTDPSKYYSQEFQLNMDKQVRANPSLYYSKGR